MVFYAILQPTRLMGWLYLLSAYIKKVPRLKSWILSEKKGFMGVFYKGLSVAYCFILVYIIRL